MTEWAYAQAYRAATKRTAALSRHLSFYNTERRRTAFGATTLAERLAAKL